MILRRRLHGEGGFTMMVTLGVLTVCAALTAAAFGAVVTDIPLRKESRDKKIAFAAAEAGVNFYLSRLNQDNEYWLKCTTLAPPNATEPSPVNQPWNGTGADPRQYRVVPGEAAKYTVELLPVVGSTCDTNNPSGTMLAPPTSAMPGTMRFRATGVSGEEKRSINVTLRRKSFLDYLYFTDYETADPITYGSDAAWAEANCRKYRASRPKTGKLCTDIQFSATDEIKGPFHTNDDVLTCNGSTFGRPGNADRLEASGPAPGWKNQCGSTAPNFNSAWQAGVPSLAIPQSNENITKVAVAPYILTGTHKIVLNDTSMTITPATGSPYSLPLPPNGVLWVKEGAGCGAIVAPALQDYTEAAGCANVRISGRYARSMTLVSDKDVIVDGDLTRASDDNLLGLIATNFIRVYHPVRNRRTESGVLKCDNVYPGTMEDVTIDAAILTLEHSFTVDNYNCGDVLSELTVVGAIAQRFRGAVGTSRPTGYTKRYSYDDRLKYRFPPSFLDPVKAAWRLLRQNEQVPAR